LTLEFCIESLAAICNSIPAAMIAIDSNYRVILLNEYVELLFNVNIDTITGCDARELGLDFGSESNSIWKCLENNIRITDKETTIKFNNIEIQATLNINPLLNGNDITIGMVAVICDNSLISLPESRMQHLETLASIGEMTAGTIHEIRNPLTSISGFVQLLNVRAARQQDETSTEYCRLITDEVTHINNILSDFLTLAKPQPNKFVKIDILRPITEVLALLYGEALMYGVEIQQHLGNEPLYLLANSEKIREVLINLCRNAFQAMRRGGKLTINVSASQEAITINITDSGHGMSDDVISNIFKPFFTTKEAGTGLGLSVCQRIIRDHHGEICVSSTLGKGTTFTLTFPRLAE